MAELRAAGKSRDEIAAEITLAKANVARIARESGGVVFPNNLSVSHPHDVSNGTKPNTFP